MPLYPVPEVGRAMKERVDRGFLQIGQRGAGTFGGHRSGRGCVYARCDQEATGGPDASVRAQV